MKVSGDRAQALCRKPPPDIWAFLIFGEDEGVVGDLAIELEQSLSKYGAFERKRLAEDDVRKDAALLWDSLAAQSIFGDAALIRLATSGDKIAGLLSDIVSDSAATPGPFPGRLIVTAGALPKKSKLRAVFESGENSLAAQTFADTEASLAETVRSALKSADVTIDAVALDAFVSDLPGHRTLANSEIEKLSLYAASLGRAVSLEDIRALGAAEGPSALNEIIVATLDGRTSDAMTAWRRQRQTGANAISVLRAFERETSRLLDAHAQGANTAESAMRLRPPVFKSAWPAFKARLDRWPPARLVRILERIYEAERLAKNAAATAEPALNTLILDLAKAAR
ncbi:MAG: DNA polymerase III subunit delta [Pseudomonadota bacterium]